MPSYEPYVINKPAGDPYGYAPFTLMSEAATDSTFVVSHDNDNDTDYSRTEQSLGSGVFNSPAGFTVNMWVKHSSNQVDTQYLFGEGGAAADNVWCYTSPNSLKFNITVDGVTKNKAFSYSRSVGVWTMYTMVFDNINGQGSLYANAVRRSAVQDWSAIDGTGYGINPGTSEGTPGRLFIAQRQQAGNPTANSTLDGEISQVAFFSGALTTGQISEYYNSGEQANIVDASGLTNYYRYGNGPEQGAGTTIFDVKGSENLTKVGGNFVQVVTGEAPSHVFSLRDQVNVFSHIEPPPPPPPPPPQYPGIAADGHQYHNVVAMGSSVAFTKFLEGIPAVEDEGKGGFSLSMWIKFNKDTSGTKSFDLFSTMPNVDSIRVWTYQGYLFTRVQRKGDGTQATSGGSQRKSYYRSDSNTVMPTTNGSDHFVHTVISFDTKGRPTVHLDGVQIAMSTYSTHTGPTYLPDISFFDISVDGSSPYLNKATVGGSPYNTNYDKQMSFRIGGGAESASGVSDFPPSGEINMGGATRKNWTSSPSGLIDEVSMWTGTLTTAQVNEIRNTGTTGRPEYIDLKSLSFSQALSGWWRFRESGSNTGVLNYADRSLRPISGWDRPPTDATREEPGLGLDLYITGDNEFYAPYVAAHDGWVTGGVATNPNYPSPFLYGYDTGVPAPPPDTYDQITGYSMMPTVAQGNIVAFRNFLEGLARDPANPSSVQHGSDGGFSMSMWYKHVAHTDGNYTMELFSTYNNQTYFRVMINGAGHILMFILRQTDGNDLTYYSHESSEVIDMDQDADRFQHFVFGFKENGRGFFFIDGVEISLSPHSNHDSNVTSIHDVNNYPMQGMTAGDGVTNWNPTAFRIGAFSLFNGNQGTTHWPPSGVSTDGKGYNAPSGIIDEVSLWTGTLTASEVSQIRNTGATGKPEYVDLKSLPFSQGLSGWWRFGASGDGTGCKNFASRDLVQITGWARDPRDDSQVRFEPGLGMDLLITGNSGYYASKGQPTGGIAMSPEYPSPWTYGY